MVMRQPETITNSGESAGKDGKMEYWNNGISPSFHYSILPIEKNNNFYKLACEKKCLSEKSQKGHTNLLRNALLTASLTELT